MPDGDAEQVRPLVDAETRQQKRIRDRTIRVVQSQIAGFDAWYDQRAVTSMAALIGTLVQGGARQAASTTDAYLSRASAVIGFPTLRPGGTELPASPLRTGPSTYGQVYSRIAPTVRYYRSTGMSMPDSIDFALDRADAMVQTDLQLARRWQARQTLHRTGATKYRRIIHPEASETGVCGLCVVAADRVYNRGNLLPIHDRCKCTVLPVSEAKDVALNLNREDLDRVYDATGAGVYGRTSGKSLLDVRVEVVQHGELGPTLVNAAHRTKLLPTAAAA